MAWPGVQGGWRFLIACVLITTRWSSCHRQEAEGEGTHAVSEHRAPLGPALAAFRGVRACLCQFLIHSNGRWLVKGTWKDGKSEAMNLRLKSPLG